MKKAEYIRRYGEERYEQYKQQVIRLQRERAARKRAQNPKLPVDKSAIKDEITVKMLIPTDDYEYYEDFLKWLKKYEIRFQKKLRQEWGKLSEQRFIIVVDCASHAISKKTFTLNASLVQLGMRKKDRDLFKKTVVKIAESREWLD